MRSLARKSTLAVFVDTIIFFLFCLKKLFYLLSPYRRHFPISSTYEVRTFIRVTEFKFKQHKSEQPWLILFFFSSVFRQKVLTKLFPSEVESDSSDDDNDDDAGVETNSQFIVRTLDKDSQERSAEREKRKLSVAEGSVWHVGSATRLCCSFVRVDVFLRIWLDCIIRSSSSLLLSLFVLFLWRIF